MAFLPWLRLDMPRSVGGFTFRSFRDSDGHVRPEFAEISDELDTIFSSYIDRSGRPISSPVIVTGSDGSWRRSDGDFSAVARAARMLFLACWSANTYFEHFPYVGSVTFRPVWQQFDGSCFITLSSKRRDGRSLDGGYEHGKIRFNLPLQCQLDEAVVDEAFLQALHAITASGTSATLVRLRPALSFVALANTDDELMDDFAEAILMGSAIEQLFGIEGEGKKRQLRDAFGQMFEACGSIRAEEAKATPAHSGITFDAKWEADQRKWWLHKAWIDELYELRSDYAHDGETSGIAGWTPFQHLLMAAFVFPLVVKKMLADEGAYTLTDEDDIRCRTIDKLLLASAWNGTDENTSWTSILRAERKRLTGSRIDAIVTNLLAQHTDD